MIFAVVVTLLGCILPVSSLSPRIFALNLERPVISSNVTNKMFFPRQFIESLRKDISGHYTNPSAGILGISFPAGWHGRAMQTPFALLVNMHPRNESGYLMKLFGRQRHAINPIIMLQSVNNSEIRKMHLPSFTISKYCKELAANATALIDGKTFQTYTVECPFSKLYSGVSKNFNSTNNGNNNANTSGFGTTSSFTPKNFNINGVGQSKVYEYKTPNRTFRLMLVVSSSLFSSSGSRSSLNAQDRPDITKYIPLIDTTAKTLKIK